MIILLNLVSRHFMMRSSIIKHQCNTIAVTNESSWNQYMKIKPSCFSEIHDLSTCCLRSLLLFWVVSSFLRVVLKSVWSSLSRLCSTLERVSPSDNLFLSLLTSDSRRDFSPSFAVTPNNPLSYLMNISVTL